MEYDIQIYETSRGTRPFSEWLDDLKDLRAKVTIRLRLDRMAMGNFGDFEPVGEGVHELKIHFGPGYRIYFGKVGRTCVLLLTGGSKRKQNADITRAKEYLADYKKRED